MKTPTLLIALALGAASAAGAGCLTSPPGQIIVPSDIMRGAAYGPEGQPPRSRYVVRMSDGERDWELELPEVATAYEVRIPLKGRPGGPGGAELATATAADKEIARQREADEEARADSQAAGDEQDEEGNKKPRPAARPGGAAPSPRTSYLLTLAKVKELYKTRNYEVALVELVSLEKDYPNDERILSMKGSLYEKLGKKQLARDTWQTVLSINPYNLQVVEALQRLGK
jgi:hypothetical protein